MTVRVLVIGIGSGDPGHLTREAVAALNEVDVFLVPDKGGDRHDLVELRTAICRAVIDHDHYRTIEVPDPERGPDLSAGRRHGGGGPRLRHRHVGHRGVRDRRHAGDAPARHHELSGMGRVGLEPTSDGL